MYLFSVLFTFAPVAEQRSFLVVVMEVAIELKVALRDAGFKPARSKNNIKS
jgi:hypothetical protein